MTSREWTERIRELANEIDKFPEFEVPGYMNDYGRTISYFYDKTEFVAAVRALGVGSKVIKDDKVSFTPKGAAFCIEAERSAVCKMVKPAQWSCEPWLTDSEVEAIGTAASITDEGVPF